MFVVNKSNIQQSALKSVNLVEELKDFIRVIEDVPQKGFIFRDITTLFANPKAFTFAIDSLANRYLSENIDYVVCIESTGFVVGSALAYRLGTGIVIVRKPGKLPYECSSFSYDTKYGSRTFEIQKDALKKDDRVIIADDALATGDTTLATINLVCGFGAEVVEAVFLCEFTSLKGREKLKPYSVNSLIRFDDKVPT